MTAWIDDRCERGHDMTDPANLAHRTDTRVYCKTCVAERRRAMWKAPLPWGDAAQCERGHDVSVKASIGHRADGSGGWIVYCRQCQPAKQIVKNAGRLTIRIPDTGDDWWMPLSRCIGADPELFHTDREEARKVIAWCEDCPVKRKCGAYADKYQLSGVWGGVWRLKTTAGSYKKYPIRSRGQA